MLAFVLFFSINVKAQTTDSTQSNDGQFVYTMESLMSKSKLDLGKIYLQQVQNLNNILPYAAFPIKGQASGVKALDIPASKYTNSKRRRVSDKADNYNKTIDESLYEIIPYSDKAEIAKGILFIQDLVSKIDKGL